MLLSLRRNGWTPKITRGHLWSNNQWECHTLEDRCRPKGIKIPKETCIPYGTYELVMDWSEKYQKIMPHIMEVKDYTGIRMHIGNKDLDTEGCIIVGLRPVADELLDSTLAFNPLYAKLMAEAGYDVAEAKNKAYADEMAMQTPKTKSAIVIWSFPTNFCPFKD